MVVVVVLAGWPRFFVGAAMSPASWPRFHFTGMSMMGIAIGLGRANGLTIGGAISTGADVAMDFSGLSLW